MKAIVFALLLVSMYAGQAAAGVQDFTIVNKTGVEITKMYISPSSMEKWDKDILSVDTLSVDAECDILVSRSENTEVWDLRIIGHDGTTVQWPNLKLNDFSKIILAIEKGQPVAYYE